MNDVKLKPIGLIRSIYTSVQGMPIQTIAASDVLGSLEVFSEFQLGLDGIDEFEYLLLITHLHASIKESLQVTPFLDDKTHGVFATRAPSRPNKLGLSIVKLIKRNGLTLVFSGNDMLDGTPVLDIKPYVPIFDVRDTQRVGWYSTKIQSLHQTKSDDRMMKDH